MFWSGAAAISLLTAWVTHQRGLKQSAQFFLISGLFTLLLAFDDLYLLHEEVFPQYFHIPDYIVLSGYAVLGGAYIFLFHREILKTNFLTFILAFAFFWLSFYLDDRYEPERNPFLAEDVSKFLGIVTWCMYFAHSSARTLSKE
jgi:hypothetical protein